MFQARWIPIGVLKVLNTRKYARIALAITMRPSGFDKWFSQLLRNAI
jgi:hypothetical protein